MKQKSVPVAWMGAAFAVSATLAAAVLIVAGGDAKSVKLALRLTARWSFLLFWFAYAGGAMATLFGPALAPLARRGREFGLSFASAHLVHLGLVIWLYWVTSRPPLTGPLLLFFMIGVVWTYLLAALSFGGLAEALGPRLWRSLRVVGLNYILVAFAYDFVLSVVHSGFDYQQLSHFVSYVPFAAMSVAAPLLSLAAATHRRRGMPRLAA